MKQKTALCYSEVFKRKVVKEIEDGVLTISQARTIYNIGGSSTLKRWINEYGINDRIGRTVHVMSKTEETENILLKREVKMLKQALDDAQVKAVVYEALIDIAKDKYGIDLKKKSALGQSILQRIREQESELESESKRPAKHSDVAEKAITKRRKS